MQNTALLALLPFILGACGILGVGLGGESPCGEIVCQAGDYCADEEFGSCLPGCKSDSNCGSSQFCNVPAGEAVGACEPFQEEQQPSAAGHWVQTCSAACQDYLFFQCIDENEEANCLQWCGTASEEAALGFAACEDASGCNFETCFAP